MRINKILGGIVMKKEKKTIKMMEETFIKNTLIRYL